MAYSDAQTATLASAWARRWGSLLPLFGLCVGALGCAGGKAPAKTAEAASSTPPTPASVTQQEPGGDAADPHFSALSRLLNEPWKRRTDKDNQLSVPLADRPNWKRVRFSLVDHFTGFRYGKNPHAFTVAFVHDLPPGVKASAFECMRLAEQWAQPKLRDFGVEVDNFRELEVRWRQSRRNKVPVLAHMADAHLDVGFERWEGTAAWVAYPAYEDACLTYATAVSWRGHPALAEAVVTRWIDEAAGRVRPKTDSRPYRLE